MSTRQRRIVVLLSVLISLTLLAAPARSADWFGVNVGSDGFGVSIGSSDWWVYGQGWRDPVGYGSYDSALAGYGAWLQIDGLGRCWRPFVTADWRPYTYGRWLYTPLGWTWVAYEPWGYFPHHYGTWALTRAGWVWVPGYDYTPANVVWVQASAYVGWYPRGPSGWSHAARSFEHGYRHGYDRGYDRGYGNGYEDGWRDAQYATYVQWRHLGDADVAHYAVSRQTAFPTAGRAAPRVSFDAPSRTEVRRRAGVDVPEARVSRRTVRIGGRSVTAVRPEGVDAAVRRYAPEAAQRVLAPEVRPRAVPERHAAPSTPRVAPSRGGSDRVRAEPARPLMTAPGRIERPTYGTRTTPPSSAARRPAAAPEARPLLQGRIAPSTTRRPDDSRVRPTVSTRPPSPSSTHRVTRPTTAYGSGSSPAPAPRAAARRSDSRQDAAAARKAPESREAARGDTKPRATSRAQATAKSSRDSRRRPDRR